MAQKHIVRLIDDLDRRRGSRDRHLRLRRRALRDRPRRRERGEAARDAARCTSPARAPAPRRARADGAPRRGHPRRPRADRRDPRVGPHQRPSRSATRVASRRTSSRPTTRPLTAVRPNSPQVGVRRTPRCAPTRPSAAVGSRADVEHALDRLQRARPGQRVVEERVPGARDRPSRRASTPAACSARLDPLGLPDHQRIARRRSWPRPGTRPASAWLGMRGRLAVVGGGDVEAARSRDSSAKPPPMQKPMIPTLPVRVGGLGQVPAAGVDVGERLALAAEQRAHRRRRCSAAAPPSLNRSSPSGQVARRGQPVALPAELVVEPEHLVDRDDAGPRAVAGRAGQVAAQVGRTAAEPRRARSRACLRQPSRDGASPFALGGRPGMRSHRLVR